MNKIDERKKMADTEIKEALTWLCKETERIAVLLEAGGSKVGLDSNRGAYNQMYAEFARRMKAIGEKYGLTEEEQ